MASRYLTTAGFESTSCRISCWAAGENTKPSASHQPARLRISQCSARADPPHACSSVLPCISYRRYGRAQNQIAPIKKEEAVQSTKWIGAAFACDLSAVSFK
jgi:hypothetical protein